VLFFWVVWAELEAAGETGDGGRVGTWVLDDYCRGRELGEPAINDSFYTLFFTRPNRIAVHLVFPHWLSSRRTRHTVVLLARDEGPS
jgi:hypothetical protein